MILLFCAEDDIEDDNEVNGKKKAVEEEDRNLEGNNDDKDHFERWDIEYLNCRLFTPQCSNEDEKSYSQIEREVYDESTTKV